MSIVRVMDTNARLSELAAVGLSRQQIADELDWTKSKVNHRLIKLGIHTTHPSGLPAGRKRRICATCGETDPTKFCVNRRLSYSRCKACKAANERSRTRRNRLATIEMLGGKCVRCGYSRCARAMHFHHTDPAMKDPEWKTLRFKRPEEISHELKKCILLCANCHAEVHDEAETKATADPT